MFLICIFNVLIILVIFFFFMEVYILYICKYVKYVIYFGLLIRLFFLVIFEKEEISDYIYFIELFF